MEVELERGFHSSRIVDDQIAAPETAGLTRGVGDQLNPRRVGAAAGNRADTSAGVLAAAGSTKVLGGLGGEDRGEPVRLLGDEGDTVTVGVGADFAGGIALGKLHGTGCRVPEIDIDRGGFGLPADQAGFPQGAGEGGHDPGCVACDRGALGCPETTVRWHPEVGDEVFVARIGGGQVRIVTGCREGGIETANDAGLGHHVLGTHHRCTVGEGAVVETSRGVGEVSKHEVGLSGQGTEGGVFQWCSCELGNERGQDHHRVAGIEGRNSVAALDHPIDEVSGVGEGPSIGVEVHGHQIHEDHLGNALHQIEGPWHSGGCHIGREGIAIEDGVVGEVSGRGIIGGIHHVGKILGAPQERDLVKEPARGIDDGVAPSDGREEGASPLSTRFGP